MATTKAFSLVVANSILRFFSTVFLYRHNAIFLERGLTYVYQMNRPVAKTNSITIFLIAVNFLFCSCGEKKRGDEVVANVKEIKIEIFDVTSAIPLDSIADRLEFIPLETSDNCLVSSIDNIRATDEYIYVYDEPQRCIFIFSRKGRFLRKITKGEDPVSPREINDFTFDEDGNITILSYRAIVKFTKAGEYLGSQQIDFDRDFIEYANPIRIAHIGGVYYLWAGSVGRKKFNATRPDYAMYKLNSSYEIVGMYFPVTRELLERPRFQEFNGGISVSPSYFADTIYTATAGVLKADFYINFGNNAKSKHSDVADIRKSESRISYDLQQNTSLCGGVGYVIPTSGHIQFLYDCKDVRYQAIVDKNSWHIKQGVMYSDNIQPFLRPVSQYNDRVVCVTENDQVLRIVKDQIEGRVIPSIVLKNISTLQNVKEGDNPVISLLSLKKF